MHWCEHLVWVLLLFVSTEALRLIVETAKPGVSVLSLCEKGDAYIMAETGKVFKKEKDMKKGEENIIQYGVWWHETYVCCVCASWGGPIRKQACKLFVVFVCSSTYPRLASSVVVLKQTWRQGVSVSFCLGDLSVTPSLYALAKYVDDFQMKTWWFSFAFFRHCLSHQRLSQ